MVRGEMGLKNVDMIPFVRTLEMAKDVSEVLASRRTSWFQGLKDGQMPRGSQETTILRIWWLNLDRLNFIQLLYDYNSLFVDLIHFPHVQSLQEKNGLKRGEDGLKAEFLNFEKVLKSETGVVFLGDASI